MTPAEELAAAAKTLRPSSPAVAAHTEWVKIRPEAADALVKWLDSWTGIDLNEHAAMAEDVHHALAVARALNGSRPPRTDGPCPNCSHSPHHAPGQCQGGSVSTITGCRCPGSRP